MYGLRDGAGRLENKGHSINLTNQSTQKEFEKALKRVPGLKGVSIIELSEAQIKSREAKRVAKLNLKQIKNGKNGNTKEEKPTT